MKKYPFWTEEIEDISADHYRDLIKKSSIWHFILSVFPVLDSILIQIVTCHEAKKLWKEGKKRYLILSIIGLAIRAFVLGITVELMIYLFRYESYLTQLVYSYR